MDSDSNMVTLQQAERRRCNDGQVQYLWQYIMCDDTSFWIYPVCTVILPFGAPRCLGPGCLLDDHVLLVNLNLPPTARASARTWATARTCNLMSSLAFATCLWGSWHFVSAWQQ